MRGSCSKIHCISTSADNTVVSTDVDIEKSYQEILSKISVLWKHLKRIVTKCFGDFETRDTVVSAMVNESSIADVEERVRKWLDENIDTIFCTSNPDEEETVRRYSNTP